MQLIDSTSDVVNEYKDFWSLYQSKGSQDHNKYILGLGTPLIWYCILLQELSNKLNKCALILKITPRLKNKRQV